MPTTAEWILLTRQRLQAGPDAATTLADRQRLVQQAELQLAAGDTAAAQQAFDRAAMLVHAADVEMGLVRTYLQAGDYRRALSFASHAAGAHRDVPAGTAPYGGLLHISARQPFAGSPGYVVEYSFGNGASMLLRQGFFGRGLAASGEQLLGIDTPPGPRGGPVFDAAGRLAGVALPHADGRDRLLPAACRQPGARTDAAAGTATVCGATGC